MGPSSTISCVQHWPSFFVGRESAKLRGGGQPRLRSAMAGDPDAKTLNNIAKFTESFRLVGDDGEEFTVRWVWEPTLPTKRKGGVTGWW